MYVIAVGSLLLWYKGFFPEKGIGYVISYWFWYMYKVFYLTPQKLYGSWFQCIVSIMLCSFAPFFTVQLACVKWQNVTITKYPVLVLYTLYNIISVNSTLDTLSLSKPKLQNQKQKKFKCPWNIPWAKNTGAVLHINSLKPGRTTELGGLWKVCTKIKCPIGAAYHKVNCESAQ